MSPAGRLSDDSLPLNLTLAWILIKLFPVRSTHDEPSVYSGTFVSWVLNVVCREVFEVGRHPNTHECRNARKHARTLARSEAEVADTAQLCPVSSGFDALRSEVDTMHRTECGRIRRSNSTARKRGVVVNDQVEAAETFESWLGVLVSDSAVLQGTNRRRG
jgi:hypothetical protein